MAVGKKKYFLKLVRNRKSTIVNRKSKRHQTSEKVGSRQMAVGKKALLKQLAVGKWQ